MGNSELAVTNIRRKLIVERERNYAWLARETKLPYKRILAEVKHGKKPITLDVAVAAAGALGCELPELFEAA